ARDARAAGPRSAAARGRFLQPPWTPRLWNRAYPLRLAAEDAGQAVVERRGRGHLDLRSKGFATQLRLEVLTAPVERKLPELRVEVGGLTSRSSDVPRVHRQVGDVLADLPGRRKLAKRRLYGAVQPCPPPGVHESVGR